MISSAQFFFFVIENYSIFISIVVHDVNNAGIQGTM